jgi:hypothetical protein
VGGRDEGIGEFYVEELEELEIENTPAPAPTVDDRRRLAAQLAAQAKSKTVKRPKSAMELIQEALRAEEAQKELAVEEKRRVAAEVRARAEQARRKAEEDARDAAESSRRAEEDRRALAAMSPEAARRSARPQRDLVPVGAARAARPELTDPLGRMAIEGKLVELLGAFAGGVEVLDLFFEVPAPVVGPLWHAHHVRAVHDADLATAWMVQRVRDVVSGRPTDLAAARVSLQGREWAAWFDLDDEQVLALLAPADVYLVGLS